MAWVGVAQVLGCSTPEQKHRVLTFFFDGVPPLGAPRVAAIPRETEADTRRRVAAERRRAMAYVSVHGPYSTRDCDLCHESEGSNRLTEEKETLCWSCHRAEDFVGDVVHPPVEAGSCGGCHDPHRSRNPSLLVVPLEALCEHCHDEVTFARLDEHRAERGEDCLRCHDPHAADRQYLLKADADLS